MPGQILYEGCALSLLCDKHSAVDSRTCAFCCLFQSPATKPSPLAQPLLTLRVKRQGRIISFCYKCSAWFTGLSATTVMCSMSHRFVELEVHVFSSTVGFEIVHVSVSAFLELFVGPHFCYELSSSVG